MAETKKAITADIEKFSGFRAKDGTTHATLKAATEHMQNVKVREALNALALIDEDLPGVTLDDRGNPVVTEATLGEFLFVNRAAIMACYKQEVRIRSQPATRKPRSDKGTKKVAPATAPSAAAVILQSALPQKDKPVVIEGVSFLDTDEDDDPELN
jgi:hypothetical protein